MNSYINTMSVLNRRTEIDLEDEEEEEGWCYQKRKKKPITPSRNTSMQNSQLQVVQEELRNLLKFQIVEQDQTHDKESILKHSKYKFLRPQRIPLILAYEEVKHSLHYQGHLILVVCYQGYNVKPSKEQTIITSMIPNKEEDITSTPQDTYFAGYSQRVYLKFDQIIVVPFAESMDIIDQHTKQLKLEYKTCLFNLLISFLNQLDNVQLILSPRIPISSILEVFELVVIVKTTSRFKQFYEELLLNCAKVVSANGDFLHYLVTFQRQGDQSQVLSFLREKTNCNCEHLALELLIPLLLQIKQLTVSYLKQNSPNSNKSASVAYRFTSQVISCASPDLPESAGFKLVPNTQNESPELFINYKRDSYFS